jgi:hypothetical protein
MIDQAKTERLRVFLEVTRASRSFSVKTLKEIFEESYANEKCEYASFVDRYNSEVNRVPHLMGCSFVVGVFPKTCFGIYGLINYATKKAQKDLKDFFNSIRSSEGSNLVLFFDVKFPQLCSVCGTQEKVLFFLEEMETESGEQTFPIYMNKQDEDFMSLLPTKILFHNETYA